MNEEKEKILYIRCTSETARRFKLFLTKHDFKNSEDGLNYLLNKEERLKFAKYDTSI